jgi:hypothetical protein
MWIAWVAGRTATPFATTRVKGKTLAVARHVRRMSELQVVEPPMGQVLSLFEVELVALDASTALTSCVTSPGSTMSWPSPWVRIRSEHDEEYATNSKRHKREEQVSLGLVHGLPVTRKGADLLGQGHEP